MCKLGHPIYQNVFGLFGSFSGNGSYERDARGIYVAPNALKLSKAGKLQLGPSDEPELSLEERKRILGLQ